MDTDDFFEKGSTNPDLQSESDAELTGEMDESVGIQEGGNKGSFSPESSRQYGLDSEDGDNDDHREERDVNVNIEGVKGHAVMSSPNYADNHVLMSGRGKSSWPEVCIY